jgi:NADH-quinone oxidoreductase subunit I
MSIDKYLGGSGQIDEVLAPPQEKATPLTVAMKGRRVHPPELEPEEGIGNFTEVELGLSQEAAIKETKRCLECDLAYTVDKLEVDLGHCIFCGLCVEMCPRHAIHLDYSYEHATYRRQDLILQKEDLLMTDAKQPSAYARPEFEAKLPKQTILLDRERMKSDGA